MDEHEYLREVGKAGKTRANEDMIYVSKNDNGYFEGRS